MNNLVKWSIVLLIIGFFSTDGVAQCAMCRASLENNVANGEIAMAARLNFGILYLFAMPYLIVSTLGYLWYRQSKKNKQKRIIELQRKKRIQELLN